MSLSHSQADDKVWHPYTRHSAASGSGLPMIVRGEGIHLIDDQGRRYVDAIASWWCNSLGHNHPALVEAIRRQAGELQHSILGNLNHPRAFELAQRLAALMPDPARHVLFASDGSSAVEQALKIALQFQHQRGQPGRTRLACIQGAYHGDTLGAMGVGYLDQFHHPFKPVLQQGLVLPCPVDDDPPVRYFRPDASQPRSGSFEPARAVLDAHAGELAAVIVEPLCLGAAGMKMYGAAWLRDLAAWCARHEVLLIVDEIATGFWRTGRCFAFEHAGIDPDLVCVGKALSGGYLPISATIVRDTIYDAFTDKPVDHTLQHGHTFCGNPIAAAAALAALDEYRQPAFQAQVRDLTDRLVELARELAAQPHVVEVRCLGAILAIDLAPDATPRSPTRPQRVRQALFDEGVLLRPLGSTVYLMPPLVITRTSLDALAATLVKGLQEAG